MATATEVSVPDLGDFADVPVIEIHVAPGDVVHNEDPLVTLESDKATMDVPSPAAGTVRELRVLVVDHVAGRDVDLDDRHVGEVAEVGNADFSGRGHGYSLTHTRVGSGLSGSMPYRAIASATLSAGIAPSSASDVSAARAT